MSDGKRFRKLPEILSCQALIKAQRGQLRGTIPDKFTSANLTEISMEDTISDYSLWSLIRYTAKEDSNELIKGIPSFSAVNRLLNDTTVTSTNIAFTPILPYPATDYDSIYTTMMCYHQKNHLQVHFGVMGVYRIAKELQLLNSDMFDNIYIGLGGFHAEKILLACCGLYLKEIGVQDVFIYNEIYGPGVTDGTIMNGGDYILCRDAMRNPAEAINRFKNLIVRDVSKELQSAPNEEILREKWNSVRKFVNTNIFEKFQSFLRGEATSEICRFWNVVVDLTPLFRESNWELYLSIIRKAMSLFFAFSRTNYCRWTPLYFES